MEIIEALAGNYFRQIFILNHARYLAIPVYTLKVRHVNLCTLSTFFSIQADLLVSPSFLLFFDLIFSDWTPLL